ncbi:MAG: hypothetical protein GF330_05155 [Candidatus Eisenbacteria bacterium]|nr:hypothetical protein [Candidatus Eisenbacteria bacterium]
MTAAAVPNHGRQRLLWRVASIHLLGAPTLLIPARHYDPDRLLHGIMPASGVRGRAYQSG